MSFTLPTQSTDNHFIPMSCLDAGKGTQVAADVYYYTNQIVNVIFIGSPHNGPWILIDAGMPSSGATILKIAEQRFGRHRPPAAILLTHGHFDHVGGLTYLLRHWQVPVYAHPLEFPYLTGKADYQPPDATVEGGLLAKMAFIYPYHSTNIAAFLSPLPPLGEVPLLPDWKWISVPGHSPGQVAFFRAADHFLISADAVITVRQDCFWDVVLQNPEVSGPPRYLTTDWESARSAVTRLAALAPRSLLSGHGPFMEGKIVTYGLSTLERTFDSSARPAHGKYVNESKR